MYKFVMIRLKIRCDVVKQTRTYNASTIIKFIFESMTEYSKPNLTTKLGVNLEENSWF